MAKPQDNVLREFNPIGKYRVRLLDTGKGNVLDIREYIQNEQFEGYTRRGIRLIVPQDIPTLTATLTELAPTPDPVPAPKAARRKR